MASEMPKGPRLCAVPEQPLCFPGGLTPQAREGAVGFAPPRSIAWVPAARQAPYTPHHSQISQNQ